MSLIDLCDEIILDIFTFLPIHDLISFSQINSQMFNISSDDLLWKQLIHRDFKKNPYRNYHHKNQYKRLFQYMKLSTLEFEMGKLSKEIFELSDTELTDLTFIKNQNIKIGKRCIIEFGPKYNQDIVIKVCSDYLSPIIKCKIKISKQEIIEFLFNSKYWKHVNNRNKLK